MPSAGNLTLPSEPTIVLGDCCTDKGLGNFLFVVLLLGIEPPSLGTVSSTSPRTGGLIGPPLPKLGSVPTITGVHPQGPPPSGLLIMIMGLPPVVSMVLFGPEMIGPPFEISSLPPGLVGSTPPPSSIISSTNADGILLSLPAPNA